VGPEFLERFRDEVGVVDVLDDPGPLRDARVFRRKVMYQQIFETIVGISDDQDHSVGACVFVSCNMLVVRAMCYVRHSREFDLKNNSKIDMFGPC
jgi:hypothetical protein